MAVREYEVIPAKLIRESVFHIELEFDAPWGFWEEEEEAPYLDPTQKYFWKRAVPERSEGWTWKDQWQLDLHKALLKRGWPDGDHDAHYSYDDPMAADGGIWNPDEDEEREEDFPPVVSFWVNIPGEWLEEHPEFLKDFEKLRNGVLMKVKGKRDRFHLNYWRIWAEGGELDGADWESSIFLVRPAREKPEAFEGGPRDWFPE